MNFDGIIDYLVTTYIGGVITIAIGILVFVIELMDKRSNAERSAYGQKYIGYSSSVGLVLLGLFVIISKFIGLK